MGKSASAATSAGLLVATSWATWLTKLMKSSLRATKSVSQLTSTTAPCLASAAMCRPIRPSAVRSEEHTSELQSLMRISYAVFCLKKKKYKYDYTFTFITQYKQYTR